MVTSAFSARNLEAEAGGSQPGFCFFETGFYYVALAGLELMWTLG